MIVADSSYIAQALLHDRSLFNDDNMVAPKFALYEVINTIWKNQILLAKVQDGRPFLHALFELASARAIQFVILEEKTVKEAYELAVKVKTTFYDAVFIALAIDLDIELKTFDKEQSRLFASMKKQNGS